MKPPWPLAGVLAAACIFPPLEDSCDVPDGELSLAVDVRDDGTTVTARADFVRGERGVFGAQPVELCDDDVLSLGGKVAKAEKAGTRVEYVVTWNLDDAPAEIAVALERAGGQTIATTIPTAPRFDVVMPANGEQISRATEAAFLWDPPRTGAQIRAALVVGVGETCHVASPGPSWGAGVDVTDSGTLLVAPATLVWDGMSSDGGCDVAFTLARSTVGDVPSELEPSSSFAAVVERSVDFLSVP